MRFQVWYRRSRVVLQVLTLIFVSACVRTAAVRALSLAEVQRELGDDYYVATPNVVATWSQSGPARDLLSPFLDMLIRQGAIIALGNLRVTMEVNGGSPLTVALCEESRGATPSTILSRFVVACRFHDVVPLPSQERAINVDRSSVRQGRDSLDQNVHDWSEGLLPWAGAPRLHRYFDVGSADSEQVAGSLFKCESVGINADRLRVTLLLLSASKFYEAAQVEFRGMKVDFSPEFDMGK